MDELCNELNNLKFHDIVKIQSLWRGYSFRKKRLPNVLYYVCKYLQMINIRCNNKHDDGRLNSCIDEKNIISILGKKFLIKIPNIRMWYDILIFDYFNGWLPLNIKTTTTNTCDNTGNLTMCVHAYTNYVVNLNRKYNNGMMSEILFSKIKNDELNKNRRKDYYFLVINKNDGNNIIINSLLGLSKMTPNLNNLPFQIKWKDNKNYEYIAIKKQVKKFIITIQKPKQNWKESFLSNMRTISL